MIRRLAPLALMLLAVACNRGNVADVTLDADAAAENNTAAKTLADLAAADKAAAAPLPAAARRAQDNASAAASTAPAPTENDSEPVVPPVSANASDVELE